MSENHIIFSCGFCDQVGEANEFMTSRYPVALECVNREACKRRQKRNHILSEKPTAPKNVVVVENVEIVVEETNDPE